MEYNTETIGILNEHQYYEVDECMFTHNVKKITIIGIRGFEYY
jgi:hypothetical protein